MIQRSSVLVLCTTLSLAASAQRSVDLYAARLSAAAALLRVEEASEARAQLERADPSMRGWEWRHLYRQSDMSEMTLRGHRGAVTSVAYFPDGSRIASGSADSTVRVWEVSTGKVVLLLTGHAGGVSTVDVSPDGSLIATGSRDKTVRIWDASNGTVIRKISEGLSQGIYQVRFRPDGKYVGVATWEFKRPSVRGFGHVYEVSSGALVRRIDGSTHPASAIDFSPDGKTIILAGWAAEVIAAPFDSGATLWDGTFDSIEEYRAVQSASFRPDGATVVVGSRDHAVRVFDAATGQVLNLIPRGTAHEKDVNAVRYSPDGRYIASGSDDARLRVWAGNGEKRLHSFVGHMNGIQSLAWSPKGRHIATGSRDSTLKVWDASPDREYYSFDVCNNGPWNAPVSWSGELMVAPCSDTGYGLWDIKNGRRVKVFPGPSGNSAFFTADNKQVVVSGWSGKARVYDVASGAQVGEFAGHKDGIIGSDYDVHSGLAVTASSGEQAARVWRVSDFQEMARLEFTDGGPYRADFTEDGKFVVGASTRGQVRVWRTSDWGLDLEFATGISAIHVETSPNGRFLLMGATDGTVGVWEVGTGKQLLKEKAHDRETYAVAFHPDGTRFVTGSYDQTLKVWDSATMQPLVTLRGFRKHVYAVNFFDGGKKLLVVDTEGGVYVLRGD